MRTWQPAKKKNWKAAKRRKIFVFICENRNELDWTVVGIFKSDNIENSPHTKWIFHSSYFPIYL